MDQEVLKVINAKLKSDFKLIKQFSSGIANLNYLIEDSKCNKVVARILRDQKPENISLEFELQKTLLNGKIKTPLFLQDINGPIVIKSKDDFITLTEYIESDLPDTRGLKHSLKLFSEVGLTLARVHSALIDFQYSAAPHNYLHPDYQKDYQFKEEDVPTSKEIKKVLDYLYTTLSNLALPKNLIHGDLNDGNFLVQDGSIVAILDLETVEFNFRILDISAAIYYMQPNSGLSYPEATKIIVDGFESKIKLTQEEKHIIPKAVQYNAACFSLWSLANEEKKEDYDFLQGFHELQERIENGFK